jgi:hypothetical protein
MHIRKRIRKNVHFLKNYLIVWGHKFIKGIGRLIEVEKLPTLL